MKKRILLVCLTIFIAILFSTGCSQTYVTTDYKVGTEGMVVEFSEANPETVYEEEEFGNSILINNKGSYNVEDTNPGKLIISYDEYRLTSDEATGDIELVDIALQGKNKAYPVGEDFPFEVFFTANRLTHLRESSTTIINYNLCYPYTTELATVTCIDTTNVGRSTSVSACKVENYNGASGQGAPIVISKIEPEILLQEKYVRPQFKIYIDNVGQGYVTNAASCEDTDINDMKTSGRVNVRAWLSSKEYGRELQCGPIGDSSGILRLSDSNSYIRCYLPSNEEGFSITKKSYVTPIIVEVEYTYVSINSQEVKILRNEVLEEPVTQGLCASYQVDNNGICQSECEYCSQHPDAARCKKNKPYSGFEFGENFSCSCELYACDQKLSKGSCIKGYCPGSLYCCSTNQCDTFQVEYNGKCIDKCLYCSTAGSKDTQICGGFNFTGFSCSTITESECDSYTQSGACIKGFCGGANINTYCANPDKAITAVNPTGNEERLCEYCARINGADSRCVVSVGSGVQIRISNDGMNKNFGCYCQLSDRSRLPVTDFVPDAAFCSANHYCCNTMALT